MIMIDKCSDGGPQMSLAQWDDSIQALGSDRFDKSLRKRVQIRTPGRQEQWLYATASQQVPERGSVERVAVQNERFHTAEEAISGGSQIPCDLRHPGPVRVTRDPRDFHSAGLEPHDEEDGVADQPRQGEHFDGEEVGSREAVPVRGQKRLPGRLRAALRCGLDAVIPEDRFDRVASELVTQVLQPAADARLAGRVLVRHADDERGDVRRGIRAPGPSRLRSVVFLGNESPVPP